jgi:hypothetical protein
LSKLQMQCSTRALSNRLDGALPAAGKVLELKARETGI